MERERKRFALPFDIWIQKLAFVMSVHTEKCKIGSFLFIYAEYILFYSIFWKLFGDVKKVLLFFFFRVWIISICFPICRRSKFVTCTEHTSKKGEPNPDPWLRRTQKVSCITYIAFRGKRKMKVKAKENRFSSFIWHLSEL